MSASAVMHHLRAKAVWILFLAIFSSWVHQAASQQGPDLAVQGLNLYQTTAYQWSVSQNSSVTTISIQQGASGSADYTVTYTRTPAPPVYTVQGQVQVSNPWSSQLQLSGIEVQVQYIANPFAGILNSGSGSGSSGGSSSSSSSSSQEGPIAASVTCPASASLAGVLLVNAADPASAAVGQLLCNFTAQLPSSDQGYVIAQANVYGAPSSGALISQPVAFDFSTISVQPPSSIGQCALVNDTFDPNTFQRLGPPTITQGLKPPRNGEVAAQLCDSRSYSYTVQWTVSSAAACGTYIISSTAVADPLNSNQPTQAATAFLEVDACNSQEQALPAAVAAAPDSDATAAQVDVTVTGTTGGGTSYSWGSSSSVSSPTVQVRQNSSSQVTFSSAFTRSADPAPAPLTITGVVTVTNPTAEPMMISEVEASYVTSSAAAAGGSQQQQVDTPATCPNAVGGSISIPPNSFITCYFNVLFNSQQGGSIWGAVVTADGVQSQSTEVTVPPVTPDTATDVGACATVSATFVTGGVGQIVPSSFTAGSQLPPPSSSPMQICASVIYTYTGQFGPFSTCGALTATSSASLNPVGGQQSTQNTAATATFTVLC